jgi:hypothetical protein
MVEARYILIHNENQKKNIICSFINEKMTTSHLIDKLYDFFDKSRNDIMNMKLSNEIGTNLNKYKFLEEYPKLHNIDYLSRNIPMDLKDKMMKISLSYESKIEIVRKNQIRTEMEEMKKRECKGDEFLVNIRDLKGKEMPFCISKNTSINTIKEKIEDCEGIPVDQQRLIYAGKKLEDERMSQYYNISANSTLHLVLRMRGGMFMEITSGENDYNKIKNNCCDIDLDKDFIEVDLEPLKP